MNICSAEATLPPPGCDRRTMTRRGYACRYRHLWCGQLVGPYAVTRLLLALGLALGLIALGLFFLKIGYDHLRNPRHTLSTPDDGDRRIVPWVLVASVSFSLLVVLLGIFFVLL